MALFDPAGWCAHYAQDKNDCDRLKGIYEQFLMRQRQMAAVLEAHGLPVLFVHCEAGQDARELLVRLDDTVSRANLQLITKQLDELVMREARLEAERDGASSITLPESYHGREDDPDIAKRIVGETSFFKSRKESLEGQKEQLEERILQLREEVTGLIRQIDAKKSEIEIVQRELKGVEELEKMKLVTTMRVNQLKRDATRLEGERGQLESAAAQARKPSEAW